MRIPKRLNQRWGSLRITSKFSIAFGLSLLILMLQTSIAYVALTITWDSNDTILYSSETQRLVLVMNRNWETVRRLQQSFFVQAEIVGADQAYQLYALPASGKIAEVVQSGAMLKRRNSSPSESDSLLEPDPNLTLILTNVSQYATVFEEATELEFQLTSTETGLQLQLERRAEILTEVLKKSDQSPNLLALYYKMRFFETEYLSTGQSSSRLGAVDSQFALQQAIEESFKQADEKASVLKALQDYENIAGEIYRVESQLQEKLSQLNVLGQSIEPSLIALMVSVDANVSQARLQIEQTRKIGLALLLIAMILGLLFALLIAILFNNSVTGTIITLTDVTNQFQQGNLSTTIRITHERQLEMPMEMTSGRLMPPAVS